MTFTPAELRLLRLSDRLADDRVRPRKRQRGRHDIKRGGARARPPSCRLGLLTDEQVTAMVHAGASNAEIAEKAGVIRRTVSRWKKAHGLARPWNGTPGGAAVRRADGAA